MDEMSPYILYELEPVRKNRYNASKLYKGRVVEQEEENWQQMAIMSRRGVEYFQQLTNPTIWIVGRNFHECSTQTLYSAP